MQAMNESRAIITNPSPGDHATRLVGLAALATDTVQLGRHKRRSDEVGADQQQNQTKKSKQSATAQGCRGTAFVTAEEIQRLVHSSKHLIIRIPGPADHSGEINARNFVFHTPKDGLPVLTTTAGWAMLPDENAFPCMHAFAGEMRDRLEPHLPEIASRFFGMRRGYWFVAPDRWKYQRCGPGAGKSKPADIVHACWKKNNSLHVDLRETPGEFQLALLCNVGKHPRHMVITDLTNVDPSSPTDLRLLELLNYVQRTKKGFFSGFTPDEKDLIKPVLRAVEIKPGEALLFPQSFPHCLTESVTSTEPEARALTFYVGLKFSETESTLRREQERITEIFAIGGQHVYQQKYGRNGFTDKKINGEHASKLSPCVFEQYSIPKTDGGKGGISSKHPLPTVEQFLQDVRKAREDPTKFATGMQCPHLGENLAAYLPSRDQLGHIMRIEEFQSI